MVHINVWKFEKIWLSGSYYPESKRVTDGRTDGHEDPHIPPTVVERGYNNPFGIFKLFLE